MKKIMLSLVVIATMSSCGGLKKMDTSDAASLLSSLTSNSTVAQISSLFTLLDTNKDKGISSTEAIGSVSENFKTLDSDKDSSLNLSELKGLLGLLK